ncbi:Wzz/FepE/Etk N-terminal domain-containing protein [Malikia sp.]|uniref:Wzz/FepE/Etk N-terminal domain-containing protein n=1 Tax=Malikia sp. TaxID=2070706 RepID=UPI0026230368|nr:Wzz/FepE/Etk N-terminal domain-containing protein [Malikia sp.]MDD2727785.1 Wzz/FepE/Etk N-terminal domain-containing protein [Malikia sp.]
MNDQTAAHSAQAPATEDEGEISLLDLLQTIADNLKLLTLGPLAVGVTALGISFAIPPTFTAKTQFLPPQQQQSMAAGMLSSLGALGGLAGAAAGLKNPADQYVAYLKSDNVQDALIERFKLQERYDLKFKVDARQELSKKARISAGKDGLITVEVDDKEAQVSAELANAHVEELQRLLGQLAVTEAQQRRLFFEKQLKQTQDKLVQAEQVLRSSGVDASALKSDPKAAVTAVAQLQAQVTAQEVKVASLRGYLSEGAPQFKQAMIELGALRAQLHKLENTNSKTGGDGDYTTRYREFKYQETLFELFSKQYEVAKIDEAREGAVIQVLDLAQTPEKKSKPKKALIAMLSTLGSGFALLLYVFVRQGLRNAKRSSETAEKLARIRRSFGFKS